MENVGENGADREDDSGNIKPQRGVDFSAPGVLAKPKLEQESGESNGGHNHESERAGKRRTAGVDHDQSEREQEQAGGDDAPPPRFRFWSRVGSGVRQGVPFQVIQGGA